MKKTLEYYKNHIDEFQKDIPYYKNHIDEFVELVCGIELLDYQKSFIRGLVNERSLTYPVKYFKTFTKNNDTYPPLPPDTPPLRVIYENFKGE